MSPRGIRLVGKWLGDACWRVAQSTCGMSLCHIRTNIGKIKKVTFQLFSSLFLLFVKTRYDARLKSWRSGAVTQTPVGCGGAGNTKADVTR